MKRFKIMGLLEEFPELGNFSRFIRPTTRKYVEGEYRDIESDPLDHLSEASFIRIKRMDEAFLLKEPEIYEHTGSVVDIFSGEKVFLLLKNEKGQGFFEVKSAYNFASNYAHTDPYKEEGETVLEAIDRYMASGLSLCEPIGAIEKVYGLETVDHHSKGWGLNLYKLPKNFKIADLIKSAKQQASDQVKAEAEF